MFHARIVTTEIIEPLGEKITKLATMNLFRLMGDMSHLLSIIVLLLKIRATRSCRGTSCRSHSLEDRTITVVEDGPCF